MSDGRDDSRLLFNRIYNNKMKKLLYFYASWCTPCRSFSPIIDKVAQSGITVQKVDVDDNSELTAKYRILSVPTVILLKGEAEINRFSGVKAQQQVIDFYNAN